MTAGPSPTDVALEGWSLGPVEAAVRARLAAWSAPGASRRVWGADPRFWPQAPASDVTGRLGWLRAPSDGKARWPELAAFAEATLRDGFDRILLLGMGGSSLAPQVLAQTLPHGRGHPSFAVLDSTHPEAVRSHAEPLVPGRTLYLVSSKSGTTLEPNAFFRFFWEREASAPGDRGRRFVAITDPGTPLEQLARDRGFRRSFPGPADVGGRYSALTDFGLVPAALIGADGAGLLARAQAMAVRCGPEVPALEHPGLVLGAALGELARAGRDKVVFLPSRSLAAFPAWAEQLLAESLGKLGRGIVPVAQTPPDELPDGPDVVLVSVELAGERDRAVAKALEARRAKGVPVLRFELASPLELGAEFFRWEFAVAACGSVLEVNPFDQPDVEHAKELARAAMGPAASTGGAGPYGEPVDGARAALDGWLGLVRDHDYVAVQAFLAPSEATDAALARLASRLRERTGRVVTVGYGPRFLHSTGQLHKGGPPSGLYLQLVDEPTEDLPVPELGLTFGQVVRAQARGDRGALEEKHRRLLVVQLGDRALDGLASLGKAVGRAGRPPGRR